MSKQEFVDTLRMALSGKIPAVQVTEHINYYEDYINTQIRMGIPEEEVMEKLGEPRLIAKSILSANNAQEETYNPNQSNNYGEQYYDSEETKRGYDRWRGMFGTTLPGWLVAIIIIFAVVLVLSVVFSVLSFLAPVLIPILVVGFLIKLFRDWLN